MSLKTYSQTLFMVLSFAFFAHATYKYLVKKKKEDTEREDINEVIMFSYGAEELRTSPHSRCKISKSMDRILHYLSKPKYSLDICMYVWSNQDITNIIMKLHFRGVKIRVIVDADMAFAPGSNIRKLEKKNIPVRWMKSTNLMHHKFCVIDTLSEDPNTTPFVMSGSLNWTNQALWGNYEDCLVTSQKKLVEQFQMEFERLWILFKPIVD